MFSVVDLVNLFSFHLISNLNRTRYARSPLIRWEREARIGFTWMRKRGRKTSLDDDRKLST